MDDARNVRSLGMIVLQRKEGTHIKKNFSSTPQVQETESLEFIWVANSPLFIEVANTPLARVRSKYNNWCTSLLLRKNNREQCRPTHGRQSRTFTIFYKRSKELPGKENQLSDSQSSEVGVGNAKYKIWEEV